MNTDSGHSLYNGVYDNEQTNVTHLPHIQNTAAGRDRQDPMHSAIFEVYFDLPAAVKAVYGADEHYLTEQVVDVDGLDQLQKTVGAGTQKMFGVDVSFLNPTIDQTYCEFTINFNLNIRNHTDAWLLKIFKAWANLGYNLSNGERTLMTDYVSESVRIAEANRNGEIWRAYIFHKVMIIGVTGLPTLNYTENEPRKLSVTFRADYWDEDLA
ncbi:MAG: hypothetical protein J6D03_03180 [Clostridia bacterium]|nr:hypothetical protein [Clostridia bacterium]